MNGVAGIARASAALAGVGPVPRPALPAVAIGHEGEHGTGMAYLASTLPRRFLRDGPRLDVDVEPVVGVRDCRTNHPVNVADLEPAGYGDRFAAGR
jgi:hypothetical protein